MSGQANSRTVATSQQATVSRPRAGLSPRHHKLQCLDARSTLLLQSQENAGLGGAPGSGQPHSRRPCTWRQGTRPATPATAPRSRVLAAFASTSLHPRLVVGKPQRRLLLSGSAVTIEHPRPGSLLFLPPPPGAAIPSLHPPRPHPPSATAPPSSPGLRPTAALTCTCTASSQDRTEPSASGALSLKGPWWLTPRPPPQQHCLDLRT